MMRRNLYILAIASLLSGNYVFAQDVVKQWSLEECIQYAIDTRQQEIYLTLIHYKDEIGAYTEISKKFRL